MIGDQFNYEKIKYLNGSGNVEINDYGKIYNNANNITYYKNKEFVSTKGKPQHNFFQNIILNLQMFTYTKI